MRNEKGSQSEVIFTTKQLSEVLNLSSRRIQQLAEEGVFARESRGKYKAIESMRNYISFLQEKGSEREGEVDYYAEKALHEKAKREKAEIELAAMRGQMHKSEHIAAVMNDMVAATRAKLLALPTKLAPRLLRKDAIAVIRDEIKREIHDALDELAEYNREVFLARSEEFVEVEDDEDIE